MAGYLALPLLQQVGLHSSCAWITGELAKDASEMGASANNKIDVLALDAVGFSWWRPMDLPAVTSSITKRAAALPSIQPLLSSVLETKALRYGL